MSREKVITGIDIGTQTIKILGVKKTDNAKEVLFLEKVDSFGVQKGRVKNPEEISRIINELAENIERKHNCSIENIFVNINGTKLQLIPSHASISVGRADQKVSEEDVLRAKGEVKMINLQSNNKKIINVFPKEWIIDGEKETTDPVGLQGFKLELDAMLLSSFSSDTENIIEALEGFEVEEENIIPGPVADAESILTPQQKELGVVLINIGAGTSSIIIYEEGKLLNMVIFPIGGNNITNDIAIGFKTEIDVAENIKKKHGTCLKKIGSKKISFELDSSEEDDEEESKKKKEKNILVFSEKDLIKIIEARVCEIFELANKEIKKVSKEGSLPGGVVLTGGSSSLSGIVDLAVKEFKLPCRIGYCKDIKGIEKDPSLTTVCGLALASMKTESSYPRGNRIIIKIKNFFSNFIP
jgi:cell division protein FtsA